MIDVKTILITYTTILIGKVLSLPTRTLRYYILSFILFQLIPCMSHSRQVHAERKKEERGEKRGCVVDGGYEFIRQQAKGRRR